MEPHVALSVPHFIQHGNNGRLESLAGAAVGELPVLYVVKRLTLACALCAGQGEHVQRN
jgi:hypothetical protein